MKDQIGIRSAKWYSFAIFTKIIRLHGNIFFIILNVRDNLNNVIFFDPQSKSKPYPTDNRDEMNKRTIARYKKKKKKKSRTI